MSATEVWASIPSAPGYEASTLGRIRSVDRTITCRTGPVQRHKGRVLKPTADRRGYLTVAVSGQISRRVHVLVLEAFAGPCPPGMEGCHDPNWDPSDNRLENLRWDTGSANKLDKVRHGRDHQTRKTCCPRDHLLVEPNLTRWALPYRVCLACSRARNRVYKYAARGVVLDFRETADAYYAEIMGNAA